MPSRREKTWRRRLRRDFIRFCRERRIFGLSILAALALSGCQAASQLLGVQPRADAPSYTVVGVYARDHGTAGDVAKGQRVDNSGAVGASGSASATSEQTQEIPAEAFDALVEAAKGALSAGSPEAAGAILKAIPSKKKPEAVKPPVVVPAPVPPVVPEHP